jgi:UDP-N-acetylglucosamine--N-acetylmuramyl-(pentapeptide) pyrophosphoryl-undecaprenol N-acetylglucosamine transferase
VSAAPHPSKTIMVMAGGTGGHIFPGLAVADYLRLEGWSVHWLGNPSGMEYPMITKRGIAFEGIQFSGLRGKGLEAKMLLPFNLCKALWQSTRILKRIRPNVLLGMGGYITFPMGLMAIIMGYPLVLHEQNSIAGLANRVLGKFAGRSLCAFPEALSNAEWVGNPLRTELLQLPPPTERYKNRSGKLHLLVVGGSLGATILNEVIPRALSLIPEDRRPTVMHQSGEKHVESLQNNYEKAGVSAQVLPFIADMASAYSAADLVICRAGAMTISEVSACGVASYLIPFPYAVDDHQTSNAAFLEQHGAAQLMPQAQFSAESLAQYLQMITRDALLEMAKNALSLAKPFATARVAQVCKEMGTL